MNSSFIKEFCDDDDDDDTCNHSEIFHITYSGGSAG